MTAPRVDMKPVWTILAACDVPRRHWHGYRVLPDPFLTWWSNTQRNLRDGRGLLITSEAGQRIQAEGIACAMLRQVVKQRLGTVQYITSEEARQAFREDLRHGDRVRFDDSTLMSERLIDVRWLVISELGHERITPAWEAALTHLLLKRSKYQRITIVLSPVHSSVFTATYHQHIRQALFDVCEHIPVDA